MSTPPSLSDVSMMAMPSETGPRDGAPDKLSRHVVCTTYRIPKAVLTEVTALTQANGISVSQLINRLLDLYLKGEGRPSYAELARWYDDYVLRKGPAK